MGFLLNGCTFIRNKTILIKILKIYKKKCTIISGAVAERLTIKGYIIICIIVTSFIYPVPVHWVWGSGVKNINIYICRIVFQYEKFCTRENLKNIPKNINNYLC